MRNAPNKPARRATRRMGRPAVRATAGGNQPARPAAFSRTARTCPWAERRSQAGPTRRPGVTLIEIMVVVAIIAILAVVLVWATGKLRADAETRQTKQIMNVLTTAIDTYRAESHGWPPYPIDPDDIGGYRSIPPVNLNQNPEGTVRVDFLCEDVQDGITGGSVGANPFVPMKPGQFGACRLDEGPPVAGNTKIYSPQLLYYALAQQLSTKPIVSRLPDEMLARKGAERFPPNGLLPDAAAYIGILQNPPPAVRFTRVQDAVVVLDAWGGALYYGWEQNTNNGAPYLQSAGSDGIWGTGDDVYSYERSP